MCWVRRGGAVADRFVDLRPLLLITQTVFWLCWQRCCGLLVALGCANVALIIAITAAGGLVQVVDSPARQAFVGSLVTPVDLPSAISLNGVVMNTAKVVGLAMAGLLIITVGITPRFALNAASYLAIITALAVIHPLAVAILGRATEPGGGSRRNRLCSAPTHTCGCR